MNVRTSPLEKAYFQHNETPRGSSHKQGFLERIFCCAAGIFKKDSCQKEIHPTPVKNLIQIHPIPQADPCLEPIQPADPCPLEELLGANLKKAPCAFPEFLIPNENNPERVAEHLALMAPGWIVSTGTERSLFDLILAPECCKGVIIRDINWKVKAYIDCVVLLLRICESRSEFKILLRAVHEEPLLEDRCRLIKERLEKANLPKGMKEYYSRHLTDLVQTYFSCDKSWVENDCFKQVNYIENEEMFLKLQSYARQGKIIATEGSIDDLQFLDKQEISVIDASNIHDYQLLDIPVPNVRLIWTIRNNLYGILYFSCLYTPLNPQEKQECQQLLAQLRNCWKDFITTKPFEVLLAENMASMRINHSIWLTEHHKIFDLMPNSSYSQQSMQMFREWLATPF